ncbi:hypothetical protein CQ054_22715 [Ochrobactrum sp. MYb29]|uniref:barstar family protein n=1 Tax=Brucella pituitosa TaxID=571256 RepID=UPI000C27518E|nr:hypothetical protein CWE02_23295 [Brucella pituitosa]PRA75729.1 hypothetical protein CQ054_22715 [Ochrobactrum sp. MYb29]
MKAIELLSSCKGPWVFKCYDKKNVDEIDFNIFLDGTKMKCLDDFYRELEASFFLPNYFGRNYNALFDVLSDLSWMEKAHFTILVNGASSLLANDTSESLAGFVEVLSRAGKVWSEPVNDGEAWDRPCIPFHTVFLLNVNECRKPLLDSALI